MSQILQRLENLEGMRYPKTEQNRSAIQKRSIKCYNCQAEGHISRNCPQRTTRPNYQRRRAVKNPKSDNTEQKQNGNSPLNSYRPLLVAKGGASRRRGRSHSKIRRMLR